jgi:predicted HTH domain antitoxin
VLYSVGANAAHGLRRTNEDKRRAVETLINDEEWATWSDREIARACGVSGKFVAAVRDPVAQERQRAIRDRSAAKRLVGSDPTQSLAAQHHEIADSAANGLDFKAVECAEPANDSPEDAFDPSEYTELDDLRQTLLWVVRNQLGRRNLTDFMRAELALKGKAALAAIATANYEASLITDGTARLNLDAPEKVRTDVEVAKLAGLGKDTIRKVERIQQEASPAVVEAVRRGEVSIDAAAHVAALPVEEQEAIAAEGIGSRHAGHPNRVASACVGACDAKSPDVMGIGAQGPKGR